MKKTSILSALFAATAAASGFAAVPTVENVTIRQDPSSRVVYVNYDLTGEDGYVTVEFLTNGVSVGGVNIGSLYGDANKFVTQGTGKTVSWKIYKSFKGYHSDEAALSARVTAYAKGIPPDYCVIDLKTGAKSFYPSESELPGGIDSDVYRTTKLVLRRIPAAGVTTRIGQIDANEATFTPRDEYGIETAHNVSFTKDYYMGVFELTQGQCKALGVDVPKNQNGQFFDTWPVGSFSCDMLRGKWPDYDWSSGSTAVSPDSFFGKLRTRVGGDATATGYDLPSEAQWEYACRAETETSFNDGTSYVHPTITEIAWLKGTAGWTTHRVGELKPNAWGLYDMHGNVAEICGDGATMTKANDTYGTDATDPIGPRNWTEDYIVIRGGHAQLDQVWLRASARFVKEGHAASNWLYGVRVCCPADAL